MSTLIPSPDPIFGPYLLAPGTPDDDARNHKPPMPTSPAITKTGTDIFGPVIAEERDKFNLTATMRQAFLHELRSHGIVTYAVKALNLDRNELYRLRYEDEEFRQEWDAAQILGIDAQEDEMARRAFKGVLEPVFWQGTHVADVRKFSDTLAMFLMKGAKPAKYRERYEVDANVSAQVRYQEMSDKELNELIIKNLSALGVRVRPREPQTYENGDGPPAEPEQE